MLMLSTQVALSRGGRAGRHCSRGSVKVKEDHIFFYSHQKIKWEAVSIPVLLELTDPLPAVVHRKLEVIGVPFQSHKQISLEI